MRANKKILVLIFALVAGWWLVPGLAVTPENPAVTAMSAQEIAPEEVEGFVFSNGTESYQWSTSADTVPAEPLAETASGPAEEYVWDSSL